MEQAIKDRAKIIQERLDELYPDVKPPLDYKDNFTMLIAVMLSANTSDRQVNKATPALFKRADTARKLMQVPYEELVEIIKPVGLAHTKARRLIDTSKILVDKYDGEVPKTMEELLKLPGVGRKVASVILTQAFDIPAFPVDTHIFRLAHRWGLSQGKNPEQVEYDLQELFPKRTWGKVHLQIVYYGREYCPARGHDSSKCPICHELGL
jgi:endonuclease-3